MKKYIGTALAVCVLLCLIVLNITSGIKLSETQLETLKILGIICAFSALYCFTVGEIAKNYSQMDKLWSLLPIVYTWIIAARGGMKLRLVLFALIVTAWGVRLTINFARKGAYSLKFWSGKEDYRWSIVKGNPIFKRKPMWTLFNLLFISVYQNFIVLAICLPALACMDSAKPMGAWDIVAVLTALSFLALETVSDEYQWKFHQTKNGLLKGGSALEKLPAPYSLGFNTTGTWAYMRHPNYLGEQGMWLCLCLFVYAAGAASGAFSWTFAGALLLVLLFIGSSSLGEGISSGKYPKYADYCVQVHKYLPIRRYVQK